MVGVVGSVELEQVVHEDAARDHERLARLEAVDTRENVDGVRAEHGKQAHVHLCGGASASASATTVTTEKERRSKRG